LREYYSQDLTETVINSNNEEDKSYSAFTEKIGVAQFPPIPSQQTVRFSARTTPTESTQARQKSTTASSYRASS
jgi:hypothetical protein